MFVSLVQDEIARRFASAENFLLYGIWFQMQAVIPVVK